MLYSFFVNNFVYLKLTEKKNMLQQAAKPTKQLGWKFENQSDFGVQRTIKEVIYCDKFISF